MQCQGLSLRCNAALSGSRSHIVSRAIQTPPKQKRPTPKGAGRVPRMASQYRLLVFDTPCNNDSNMCDPI